MVSEFLPVHLENLNQEVEEKLQHLNQGASTWSAYESACKSLRQRGIASLLMTSSPAQLRSDLSESARLAAQFLSSEDQRAPLSRVGALADAICIGSVDWIAGWTAGGPPEFDRDAEFEEDYHFYACLAALATGGQQGWFDALLARYIELADAGDDPRAEAIAALLEADSKSFVEALAAITREHEDRYRSPDSLPPEETATEAHVSIETWALLQLANSRGCECPKDWPYVPEVLRTNSYV